MTNILIFIVAFLFIVTLVQILRVSELMAAVQKTDVNDVTDKDNKTQARLFLIIGSLFIGFVIWQILEWGNFILPPASSDHGAQIDTLMQFSMGLILTVFFILTPMLFFFAYKYRGRTNNTAYYYTHNNKLEIIWTIIPTIVLTGVIIFGLKTWDKAMNVDTTDAQVIEVYAKQFDWTARYSGADSILGSANYKLVGEELDTGDYILFGKGNLLGVDINDKNAEDDMITKEVHLTKEKPVLLKFRSQDVIHSAFLPHFRVQMNCVPGMTTQFAFTPTQTTQEMKQQEGEDFEYILLCNKICGSAHYNMQMSFVVETEDEYNAWYHLETLLKQRQPEIDELNKRKTELEKELKKLENKKLTKNSKEVKEQLEEELTKVDKELDPLKEIKKGLKEVRKSRTYADLGMAQNDLEVT